MDRQSSNVQTISAQLHQNVAYMNELIGVGVSWDILAKSFRFANVEMMAYAANGFFLTMNMVLILEDVERRISLFVAAHGENNFTMQELVDHLATNVAFVQVQPVNRMDDAVRFILSGPLVIFMDGFDQALMIDTRIYPMRGISEPDVERTVRGARDGFGETMLMNTALIRRRLRDPKLRVELMQIGTRSQTDVSLLYLQDIADPELVSDLRQRLKSIETDGLFMGEQTLTEHLGKVKWNPFPIVRYTQRPDVAAIALTEGQIVIVVDTSPDVIIAPTSLFHHLQHPQEFHSYPTVGTYMRITILLAFLLSVFLPGVFLVMNANPEVIPRWLVFMRADRGDPLPLWVELIVAEIALDMLRLAVINTPKNLASSVGIVAALLFGQFASKIHLLQPEVLVYMAFVMIGQFALSSYELGSANQVIRYGIIVLTAVFGGYGFVAATAGLLILLLRTQSFGLPYLWPLVPFQWKNGLREVISRSPMQHVEDSVMSEFFRRKKFR